MIKQKAVFQRERATKHAVNKFKRVFVATSLPAAFWIYRLDLIQVLEAFYKVAVNCIKFNFHLFPLNFQNSAGFAFFAFWEGD